MPKSKEILIFGGSFNPAHQGHQLMAEEILKSGLVDGIWFLPVFKHDFEKMLIAAEHRLAMLKLMLGDMQKNFKSDWPYFLRIEEHEIRDSGLSCTHDTLKSLATQYPQFNFSFLIGSDNLPAFNRWFDRQGQGHKTLLQAFKFYVYPRAGYPMKPLYKGMTALKNVSEMDISSTQVREILGQLDHDPAINERVKKELLQVLNPLILKYIMDNCLYQNK